MVISKKFSLSPQYAFAGYSVENNTVKVRMNLKAISKKKSPFLSNLET
jgi:hypothetical protein